MRATIFISLRVACRAILPGLALLLSGCEKPKLRSDGAKDLVETTSPGKPVDPFSPPGKTPSPSSGGASPQILPAPAPTAPDRQATAPSPSTLDPAARVREYARLQKMLEAQMVGIRTLESDLARHSASLTQLRNQHQLAKSLQAGARSGGVRIERIGGESTLVDRKAEARELELKIKAEEPFVAQLTTALQGARRQYEDLRRTAEALLIE